MPSILFPHYRQLDSMDCGPTCLKMVAKFYGKAYSLPFLRERCYLDREGVSVKGISEAAENIGFRTLALKLPSKSKDGSPDLGQVHLPCIVHWDDSHFVVVYKVKKSSVLVADPAAGKTKYSHDDFNSHFDKGDGKGVVILLETTPTFFDLEGNLEKKVGFGFLMKYLSPHRRLIIQLIIGLLLGTIFSLIVPFLTQSIVDIGIDGKNVKFIYLILVGQLMIFFSRTLVQFFQSWITLHISVRINVNLISDFLIKLMKLPLGFFDAKNIGDLLQRMGDHSRIERFLTSSTLSILISVVNFIVFGAVLAYYSIPIFLVFLISSILYLLWIAIWLKKRREVDFKAFGELSANQASLIEIIQGMPEIKLQGSQIKRRWKWAKIQAKLFTTQMRSLAISQYQDIGASSLNQLKDILITVIAATSVVEGKMTLGMMLAIQYIIGQLNGPLNQFVGFIRSAQDASISLERISEIHENSNEERIDESKFNFIPEGDITIEGLGFGYSPISERVLNKIDLTIPRGKITAIVGASGSGKTTLLKLLLGFYEPLEGRILIGDVGLDNIYHKIWRAECGVVMQNGYLFADTIANNIAESDDHTDMKKVLKSTKTANINDFIQKLPLGLNTKLGAAGNGISQGQRQRLLIARAVYKDPQFIFFDEATNALDAINESIIMENLKKFFKGRTAIVVAHRLSTVKTADKIVVLDKGEIVEQGSHEELMENKSFYFTLIKNQLELASF